VLIRASAKSSVLRMEDRHPFLEGDQVFIHPPREVGCVLVGDWP